jgi:predicted HTH domain antitoxin
VADERVGGVKTCCALILFLHNLLEKTMQAVTVRELKNNPSVALRQCAEDVVVVTNRDHPQALLVDLASMGLPSIENARLALAVSLFKQQTVSLGYAARMAGKTLADMCALLAAMQIPLVQPSAVDLAHDLAALHGMKQGMKQGLS